MGYQVLARKWRPRLFTEMVGQEHVLRALINGLDNDRLHHAYLFTGTRGVGKTTLARILAKCLNCEAGVSSTPCNQCGSCLEISEGRFVDLIEVDAASRTKVEDTRELLENVQYAPTRGRYKVYLIDEVHMLSAHSFNALLKTLEEPPPHVKFLLATTDPQKLPVTILSRCLQFNLKNLSPERIVGHLEFILGEEKIPFEQAALWELGRAADGSMRDALSLTDQAIAHGGGTLTAAEVTGMLGTIDRSSVVGICEAVAAGEGQRALELVEHMADHAPDYTAALADMLVIWHQVAIAQTVPDALDPVQEHHDKILTLARDVSREDVQLFYQMTLMGRRDLPFAADPRSGFEMVLLRLIAFRPVDPEQGEAPVPRRAATSGNDTRPAPEVAAPAKKPEARPPGDEFRDINSAGEGPSPTALNASESESVPRQPESRPSNVTPIRGDMARPSPRSAPRPAPDDSNGAQVAAAEYDTYLALAKKTETAQNTDPDSTETSVPPPSADKPAGGPGDVPAAPENPPAEKIALSGLTPETWSAVCDSLGQGGLLHNTAVNLVLEAVEGNRISFLLDADNSALYDESQQQRLGEVLSNYFEYEVHVSIRVDAIEQESPRMIAERVRAERLQGAIESLRADPHVQEIHRLFDARLVESSVKPIDH